MKTINVSYRNQDVTIYIKNNLLNEISDLLDNNKKYFVLTDENVYNLYGDKIKLENVSFMILNPGEDQKTMFNVNNIIQTMLEVNFNKGDVLINFGGGVISDLGGFVASIYKRGITYYNIPTTLLSQVDAAIGGKTAVDIMVGNKLYKNQIGSVYQPSKIFIDPKVLNTLDYKEYLSGLGEVIKYGLCFDKDMFYSLFNDFLIENIIYKCVEIKANITSKDEFDQNYRLALNYGHTIGHAIEAINEYQIPHGICILYGMIYETQDENTKEILNKFIDKYNIDYVVNLDIEVLKDYILQDKKIKTDYILLPVLKEIGKVEKEKVKISEFFKRFV